MEQRLKEAEENMSGLAEACKISLNAFEKHHAIDWNELSVAIDKAKAYMDKYHKPKDELFEKFNKFVYEWLGVTDGAELSGSFTKFKEIFADELSGTKALDEAIEKFSKDVVYLTKNDKSKFKLILEELRSKYQQGEG